MAVFTINVEENVPPVVEAGPNATINSTQTLDLNGSANDPNGFITSSIWEHIDADGNPTPLPGGAVIINPFSLITTVTGLTFGVYIFRLTAFDNGGGSSSDTMNANVLDDIVTLSVTAPSEIDGNTDAINITMQCKDADGVVSLEILDQGVPGSNTSFPPGTNAIINPKIANIPQPYPATVDFVSSVTDMTGVGQYQFSISYRGIGDNAIKRREVIVVKKPIET